MEDLHSDSATRNSAKRRRQTLLKTGAEVEVSSADEGFKGAWYGAIVLKSPPKSSSKKKKNVLVQYKTLVTDDGSAPLTELVHTACIRPLPPEDLETCCFEENDVVDAGYRDGWWTGTVKKVLKDSRYRIYFENPPDVIDFHGRDLRFHRKWVNGEWVRPKKQETTGSIFSSGTVVEVNVDQESVRDAWFTAIVIQENEDRTFLVKYGGLDNSDKAEAKKAIVDSFHIRPTPPHYANRDYELLETVETRCDGGWRLGIITKILARRRYNVFFKQRNENKEFEHSELRPHVEWVDGKWKGKCTEVLVVSDSPEQLGDSRNSSDNLEVAAQFERSAATEKSMEEDSSSMCNLMEQTTDCNKNSPSYAIPSSKRKKNSSTPNGNGLHSRSPKKLIEGDAAEVPLCSLVRQLEMPIEVPHKEIFCGLPSQKTGGKRTRITVKPLVSGKSSESTKTRSTGKASRTKKWELIERNRQKVDIITRRGRFTRSPFRSPQTSVAAKEGNAVSATAQDIKKIEDITKEYVVPLILGLEREGTICSPPNYHPQRPDEETVNFIMDQENYNLNKSGGDKDMQKDGGTSQKRKRGRPPKLAVICSSAMDSGIEHDAGDVANKVAEENHMTQEVELQKQARQDSADCTTKEVDMISAGMSKHVADDDQPLSTWLEEIHSSAGLSFVNANARKEMREKRFEVMATSTVSGKGDGVLDGNQWLPFVKRSPIWKTVESMEAFQILPQKPHFCPLAEYKEEYREGSAIGNMVTFANLFEKISVLKIDDPESVFKNILESLNDLERFGFDITLLQGRVGELLSIKNGQAELLNELKDSERLMKEHADEQRELNERINDIQKMMSELQEELAFVKSKMEDKDLEISRMSSLIDAMSGQIINALDDFKKVATASWQLP